MSKTLFRESVSGDLKKKGNRWKGVLAVPGQGSSGYYSEEVLREYGPKALAPGAKAFVEHNPERPVRDMIGVYPEGAYYEEGVGLVGELDVFPHWAEFIEAVAPHTGLSIYMMGEADDDGNIVSLFPDRQNGVDLVSYPGLEGSGIIEKLYESAKAASSHDGTTPVVTPEIHSKENKMEIEALAAKVDTLAESLSALLGKFDTLAESLKPVEVAAEETDLAAVVEAAVEAGLPRESRDVVVESVKAGAEPEKAIASQKALVESIRKQVAEASSAPVTAAGRVVEAAGAGVTDFKFNVFGDEA
jgi:hypothetical protein